MARRPRPAPTPPPEAPLAAELLTAPGAFFQKLRVAEPRPWRYVAPVLLAAVLAGVVYALLLRPVGTLAGSGAGLLTHVSNVFGTFFLTVVSAALMWGLGYLGAGREGRAAEVYGATFALLPPLYLLLAVLLLVLPGPNLSGLVLPADWSDVLRAIARAPLTRAAIALTLLGTLAQFVLAYRGFLVLTGSRRRAFLSTLSPLVPVLLLTLVGFGPLLAGLF
ncbi:YIP1 family protein [Deinococcus apachensis]|uniref:YIP1 family protein n=1 Tax=Deinococcus apachensis TaxID=309886 RepID=UPI00035D5E0E|nr:YIP1 family protein [Deinococcus apachensis]